MCNFFFIGVRLVKIKILPCYVYIQRDSWTTRYIYIDMCVYIHHCCTLTLFVYVCSEGIEYMKIIRDTSPNHYMVLVKFKSQVRNLLEFTLIASGLFLKNFDSRCTLDLKLLKFGHFEDNLLSFQILKNRLKLQGKEYIICCHFLNTKKQGYLGF